LLIWRAAALPFLSDDWRLVDFTRGTDLATIFSTNWHGVPDQGGFYRPLVRITLLLNQLVSELRPGPYHLINVLLHALNAALVYWLYRLLVADDDQIQPAVAAALFLTLPVHTDSVYWVAGRTDTLCATFYLASIVGFCRYLVRPTACSALLSLGGCCGALLSKEIAITLPVALAAVAALKGGLRRRSTWFLLAGALLSLGGYFLVRLALLGSPLDGPANSNFTAARIFESLGTASRILFGTGQRHFGPAVLVITALLVGARWLRSRKAPSELALPLVLLALTIAPALGLMTRWYLYIPSIFACLIVARAFAAGEAQWRGSRWALGAAVTVLLLYNAAVMLREGTGWAMAGELSRRTLKAALTHAPRSGPLLMLNVPSAVVPPDGLGEKPVFAYNLERAVALSRPEPRAKIVVINHILLLGHHGLLRNHHGLLRNHPQRQTPQRQTPPSQIEQIGDGQILATCDARCRFSFHGEAVISGRQKVIGSVVRRSWGTLSVAHPRRVRISLSPDARHEAVVFDGISWAPLATQ
jgi:hypothetical protein